MSREVRPYCLVLIKLTVIIAVDRLSPQEAGKQRRPAIESADELPLIRAFSDIAWMSWKAWASDPKNIHYFMSLSITNRLTRRIVSRAVQKSLPEAGVSQPGARVQCSDPARTSDSRSVVLNDFSLEETNSWQALQTRKLSATSFFSTRPLSATCISLKSEYSTTVKRATGQSAHDCRAGARGEKRAARHNT